VKDGIITIMSMQHIGQAVVHGGQVTLSGLDLPDGQRVEVIITQIPERQTRTIAEIHQLIGGAVVRYDDPFEPAISPDSWEMLK
jgi:hypothetical protein